MKIVTRNKYAYLKLISNKHTKLKIKPPKTVRENIEMHLTCESLGINTNPTFASFVRATNR